MQGHDLGEVVEGQSEDEGGDVGTQAAATPRTPLPLDNYASSVLSSFGLQQETRVLLKHTRTCLLTCPESLLLALFIEFHWFQRKFHILHALPGKSVCSHRQ